MASGVVKFFLVIPPGLEDLGLKELERIPAVVETSAQPPNVIKGGIELELPLAVGLGLNGILRIPTRILMRVADFGCRDFPKLFRKVKAMPWGEWLGPDEAVSVKATSHNSRLRMKKRIEETVEQAIEKSAGPRKFTDGSQVLVRVHDDVVYLSLNTSKDNLYQRGFRIFSSEAPLRENLAAALLLDLFSGLENQNIESFLDPMMGGGTFLEELLLQGVWLEGSPCFTGFGKPEVLQAKASCVPKILFGCEMDEKTFISAKKNLSSFSQESMSLFHSRWEDLTLPKNPEIIAVNPPWGHRIKSDLDLELAVKLTNKFKPKRLGILLPENVRLKNPSEYQVRRRLFQSGGLAVQFLVYERR